MATTTASDRMPMDARQAMEHCTRGALWTVGASDFELYSDCLQFKARIHPRRKDGTRSDRARVMRVRVELTPADLYRVTVGYLSGRVDWVEHFRGTVFAEDLARVLVALDSGTESDWSD